MTTTAIITSKVAEYIRRLGKRVSPHGLSNNEIMEIEEKVKWMAIANGKKFVTRRNVRLAFEMLAIEKENEGKIKPARRKSGALLLTGGERKHFLKSIFLMLDFTKT